MSEPTEALAWAHRAEEARLLTHSVCRWKIPLIYGTTFHAQQCAEKYLKAVLVSRQYTFPYGRAGALLATGPPARISSRPTSRHNNHRPDGPARDLPSPNSCP
jgi:hypothetical protein